MEGSFLEGALFVLSVLLLAVYVVFMALDVVALIFGCRWLYSYGPSSHSVQDRDCVGVSILKPLMGFDLNMKENLESFFQLDYPKFEIIFCIAEAQNKPVLKILDELGTKYPTVEVRIFQGGKTVGINPKINNILSGYRSAKHQFIWISDGNIKTPADCLSEMSRHMLDPLVGLVHQLPYVDEVEDFAGYLDKVYFGTQHARVYLLGAWSGQNCANGMSWLIRKAALEQQGGLQAFTQYLAEDFFMGKAMWQSGWKFVLSSLPARQNPSVRSLSNYQTRIIRWGRLRATMMPWPGLLEPLTESICLGTMAGLCLHHLLGLNFFVFFLFHMVMWFCLDIGLIRVVDTNHELGSIWYIFLAWCLREVWTLPLFVAGVWSREVVWKGQRYRLQFGGKAIKLD